MIISIREILVEHRRGKEEAVALKDPPWRSKRVIININITSIRKGLPVFDATL